MTPSEWHDRDNDAGHDEMQIAFYLGWRNAVADGERPIWRYHRHSDVPIKLTPGFVEVEFPLISGKTGVPLSFADVAVRFDGEFKSERTGIIQRPSAWVLFELKPTIKSVGSLIRQCHAIEAAALRSDIKPTGYIASVDFLGLQVVPVVYENDPKLQMLKDLREPFVALPLGKEAFHYA